MWAFGVGVIREIDMLQQWVLCIRLLREAVCAQVKNTTTGSTYAHTCTSCRTLYSFWSGSFWRLVLELIEGSGRIYATTSTVNRRKLLKHCIILRTVIHTIFSVSLWHTETIGRHMCRCPEPRAEKHETRPNDCWCSVVTMYFKNQICDATDTRASFPSSSRFRSRIGIRFHRLDRHEPLRTIPVVSPYSSHSSLEAADHRLSK